MILLKKACFRRNLSGKSCKNLKRNASFAFFTCKESMEPNITARHDVIISPPIDSWTRLIDIEACCYVLSCRHCSTSYWCKLVTLYMHDHAWSTGMIVRDWIVLLHYRNSFQVFSNYPALFWRGFSPFSTVMHYCVVSWPARSGEQSSRKTWTFCQSSQQTRYAVVRVLFRSNRD